MGSGPRAFAIFLAASGLLYLMASPAVAAQTKHSPAVPHEASAKQAPLALQSSLVLVPVFVYDQARMAQAPKEELPCVRSTVEAFYRLLPTEPYLPENCDAAQIRGLTAKDLRLFQDGVEQKIANVEPAAWWTVVRDNLGWYMQSSDTARGIWGSSDLSRQRLVPPGINRDFYILAYVPRDSKAGCHRIKVEVNRPNALVFARDQYCTGQSPSDPLIGTTRGKELERLLVSEKRGRIPMSLQTATFYTGTDTARVDICLQFPWNDLHRSWDLSQWAIYARIGIMGVVRKQDGTVAARFSDLLYPSYWPTFVQGGEEFKSWDMGATPGAMRHDLDALRLLSGTASEIAPDYAAIKALLSRSDVAWLPTRYETQMDIPPGDYNLEVVLSDEEKFGRAEAPLIIDAYEGKQLALSSVALCKRLRSAAVAAKEATQANFALQYVPLVSKDIWFTPAGDTHFEKGEPLFAYFEVYEPLLSQNSATVELHLRILDASTGKLNEGFAPVDAAPYERAGSSVLRIARKVPIDQLPKGTYRLEVQVTDSAGRSTAWRAANFAVE